MGDRFTYFRLEDALAMVDNRVDLAVVGVGSIIDELANFECYLELVRQSQNEMAVSHNRLIDVQNKLSRSITRVAELQDHMVKMQGQTKEVLAEVIEAQNQRKNMDRENKLILFGIFLMVFYVAKGSFP